MKTYFKKSIILSLSFVAFYTTSCKKSFLEVENTSLLHRQSYVKDLNSMSDFVNGIYLLLNSNYERDIGAAYPDLVADNLKPLATGTQSLLAHYSWSQIATDFQQTSADETSVSMNGIWMTGYRIIRACNFVIESIDQYNKENPQKADDLKGQALAIRAMVHFKLVNIFAQGYEFTLNGSHPGVPYITTSDISKPYTRQSVGEVYNEMIADLNNASQLLPIAVADTRFMNRAAVKAFLARIYLFKGDFTNAKDLAAQICTEFPLMTIAQGYPNDLFKEKKNNQSEILYRLTPVTTSTTSGFLGGSLRGPALVYTATDDISTLLNGNSNDIRRSWVTSVSGLWNVTKFPQSVTPELGLTSSASAQTQYYPPVIRSSEMFLVVAESAARLGDENTARTYLDAIRKRANPSASSTTATGAALLDLIYTERRKELAFEGIRMFDLQRWKLGVHRTDALPGMPKDLPYPNNKSIAPIHLLDVKLQGLAQNPGY